MLTETGDVIAAATSLTWYENLGDGLFGTAHAISTGPDDAWSPSAADLDGDHDLDVLAMVQGHYNDGGADLHWLRNGGDGVGDACDNCATESNPYQEDIDADGAGDACDTCTDTDGDGLANPGFPTSVCPADNCPLDYNPDQRDGDGDGWADACDVCPLVSDPEQTDPDGDGVGTLCDGCPYDADATQADADGDGTQDACDTCPDIADTDQADTDGLGAFGPPRMVDPPMDVTRGEGIFAADIDGDGDNDVVLPAPLVWYENLDGAGTFGARRPIASTSDQAESVFCADLDGDGDLDVLSGAFGSASTQWYENQDGRGTFGPPHTIEDRTGYSRAVFAADVDNDGDLDVLTAGPAGVAWFENLDGAGTFGPARLISASTNFERYWSVFAADVDRDGNVDVLAGKDGYNTQWFRNVRVGDEVTWTAQVFTTNQDVYSVFVVDVDGDGDLDALTSSISEHSVRWHPNLYPNGVPSLFGPGRTISTTQFGSSVFATDVDGDGDIDAVTGETSWFENLGAGTFGPEREIGSFAKGVFVADLDQDGDGDVVTTSGVAWYENGGDGVGNACDNCPTEGNRDQADADGDGAGDACDACPHDPANDGDQDGRCADVDNCPGSSNASQADADNDGVGDVCDNCPSATNGNQLDSDGDGVGDVCDNCASVTNADQANHDADPLGDACDNCPSAPNANQSDQDGDGIGDACDTCNDVDHDTVCAQDNCPTLPNPDQADQDGDGQGDACEPPVLSVSVTPSELWPPNHRLVEVTPTITASAPSGAPTVRLVSVTSNEPDDAPGSGDGSTTGDIVIEPDRFLLRAERMNGGSGRTYTIVYEATTTNGSQLTVQATATVTVPPEKNGTVDPIVLSLGRGAQGTIVSWPAVPGAEAYHAIRGEVRAIRERSQSIDLGAVVCLTTPVQDAAIPPPGVAYFYVVEYVDDGAASGYGTESVPKPREPSSGGCAN
jgi:VCBS repeat protein/thrombospondin type 3 repeat protein